MDSVLDDRGFNSRKFWYAVGTSMLIFSGGLCAGHWSLFGPHYEMMMSGLIGCLTLYLGGNVTNKYMLSKLGLVAADAPNPPKPEDPKPVVK